MLSTSASPPALGHSPNTSHPPTRKVLRLLLETLREGLRDRNWPALGGNLGGVCCRNVTTPSNRALPSPESHQSRAAQAVQQHVVDDLAAEGTAGLHKHAERGGQLGEGILAAHQR